MRTLSACILAFAAGTWLVSCTAPPPSASLWPADSSRPVGTSTAGSNAGPAGKPSGLQGQKTVLLGANNETVSFQFALQAPRNLQSPMLRIAEFRKAGGPAREFPVELFRMHSVEVGPFPGWHIRSRPASSRNHGPRDALVPIASPKGGIASGLDENEASWFWADVTIPKGTDEGVYTSQVELTSAGLPVGTIPIELTVWPFVLPDETRLPLIAEVDHMEVVRGFAASIGDTSINAQHWNDHPRRAEITEALHTTMRALQAHRLTPILPGMTPRASMSARNQVVLDWSQFDSVIEPVMSGAAFENRIPAPWMAIALPESVQNSLTRSGGETVVRDYFAQATAHLQQKGWASRAFVTTATAAGMAEQSKRDAAREFAELAATASGGAIRVASPLIPQDMSEFGWYEFPHTELDDVVDIWFPPAQFFDAAEAQRLRDRRGLVWFAVDRPPYSGSVSIHAMETDVRVVAWQARFGGADGVHVPRVNSWPAARDGSSAGKCIAANPNTLLYPGGEFGLGTPIPSVRLKHLRRSMQDAAYLQLLDEHGLEHVARAVTAALVSGVGSAAYRAHFADGKPPAWNHDPVAYELARQVMASELMKSAYGRPTTGQEDFVRSAAWLRLMDEGGRVHLRPEGIRVRPVGTARDPEAELQLTLSVTNSARTPLTGEISATGPPRFEATEVTVQQAAGESVFRLSARENLRRLLAGGTRDLAIEFSMDAGAKWTASARLALAAAGLPTSPVRIDGDLSDWPLSSSNSLADFQSVAPPSDEPGARTPRNATAVYVLRDDRNLYFGIRCDASDGRPREPARKTVAYDDLVPMGEDLVEILLDPDNLGTRDPGDLYHLVVKRSGADLAERGFAFEPPWCRRVTWAADVDVAVRDGGRQWSAEVQIPLAAFSPGPHRNEVWGVNVARFDPGHQEFSTWSGAVGNAYDPLSLGNLYMP